MSRRIPAGAILITPAEARMLYQAANLGELRKRHRVGDHTLYRLLTDLTMCAFTAPDASPGNETRQPPATDEREWWTVQQIARETGQAARTVRLSCQRNELPAQRAGNAWTIHHSNAETYIQAHTT